MVRRASPDQMGTALSSSTRNWKVSALLNVPLATTTVTRQVVPPRFSSGFHSIRPEVLRSNPGGPCTNVH